jgi:hypothetical protein
MPLHVRLPHNRCRRNLLRQQLAPGIEGLFRLGTKPQRSLLPLAQPIVDRHAPCIVHAVHGVLAFAKTHGKSWAT